MSLDLNPYPQRPRGCCQKAVLEQRYRGLMEDSIQDAIYLSTRNNELMQENQVLRQGTIWAAGKKINISLALFLVY